MHWFYYTKIQIIHTLLNWIGKYNSYLINKTNDAICFMVKEASRCSRDFEK